MTDVSFRRAIMSARGQYGIWHRLLPLRTGNEIARHVSQYSARFDPLQRLVLHASFPSDCGYIFVESSSLAGSVIIRSSLSICRCTEGAYADVDIVSKAFKCLASSS
nr:hypothetical protein CFP56_25946 [Quercus suber]